MANSVGAGDAAMLLLQRDAIIAVLALGTAAALYAVSFDDLGTRGPLVDAPGTLLLRPFSAAPISAAVGWRHG
jgi:hypothetical protein